MKKFLAYLLNIFLPKTCHCCGEDLPALYGPPLCAVCISNLKEPGPLVCRRCGITLPHGGATCYSCRGEKGKKYKCRVIRSGLVFTPEAQSLIHNFKYNGHIYLAGFLAGKMAETLNKTKDFKAVDIIAPVPLHFLKLRRRGYNQSALLARLVAAAANISYDEKLLKRNKNTSAQAKLKKENRLKNVQEAFVCAKNLKRKKILLIDDVATTTATLEACALALKNAGALKVYALTLAREE